MTYYDVYFLSTPMDALFQSYTDKRIWLERYFGSLAEKRLILTHRKDLAIGDYLVDDTTRNGAGNFTGEHIHFGTGDFPDWEAILQYLLAKARNRKQFINLNQAA
jgi:5'(3')-deoxyribonucleotidase